MTYDDTEYGKLLGRVFDEGREGARSDLGDAEYERLRYDFVFHMTDWTEDFEALTKLRANPSGTTDDEATTVLIGFLYHAVPHLRAAAKLLLDDIPDAFDHLYDEALARYNHAQSMTPRP